MKIIIAGGSGQVGTILARHFHRNGQSVVVLSRSLQKAPWRVVHWDGSTLGPWLDELNYSNVLINLAGRSVNCRYTRRNRREILDSRLLSTQILHQAIAAIEHPPAVWLNASTATIYRHALDRPMDESTGEFGGNEAGAPDTWNFSIQVARAWEDAFFSMQTPGIRKVALRSAMTFSADRGGVFDVFLKLVRYGLGGTTMPGTQFVSWIHEVDFIRSVEFLIASKELTGAVNLASPYPLPNREFLAILRKTWAPASVCQPHGECWNWAPSCCAPNLNWCSRVARSFPRGSSKLAFNSNIRPGLRPPRIWSRDGGRRNNPIASHDQPAYKLNLH